MRFLCLHGKGTSGAIFKSQTASFRSKLNSSFSFDFVDAPLPSATSPDISLFWGPPYYTFWEGTAVENLRASHQWFLEKLTRDGPYDGVLLFSQGCALIASFLMYHQAHAPHIPLPFKVAIFICGGLPLKVLEDLGVGVSEEAHNWDHRTRDELHAKVASITTIAPGVDRWATDGEMAFNPSALLDPSNVFGLDITQIPAQLRICIPTVHIYGLKDPRYPASIQLAKLCDSAHRRMYDHGGGHEIPRTKVVSESIAELVEWSALMAGVGNRS